MKNAIAGVVLGVAVLGGLLLRADGDQALGAAGEKEVSKNPALLVSPAVKVGELSVYGARLGDSIEKIAADPAFARQEVPERPLDTIYRGRDACYFAYEGKIYRIKVLGDVAKGIPTYDASRLQVAMGKADEIVDSRTGEESRLSFYGRHVEYTIRSYRVLSVVTEVDIYLP